MSILAELLRKKTTFPRAAEKAARWVTAVVGHGMRGLHFVRTLILGAALVLVGRDDLH